MDLGANHPSPNNLEIWGGGAKPPNEELILVPWDEERVHDADLKTD